MKYRKDIDGLRALAVTPVILNHAGIPFFSGGFIGVDIFFVISGFLISQIITSDVDSGKFSIIDFYDRRARRILPALVPVIIFSIAVGYISLLPDSFENLSESIIATLLFSNNILLALTSGYWELESSFKPFLHTWSLGVEEQFYLFYPIIVIIIYKFQRNWFSPVIFFTMIASLALSVTLTSTQPNASFYLIHTRAWELLSGALTAAIIPKAAPRWKVECLSSAGLLMILSAIFAYTEHLEYPSFYATLPCAGTTLIIMYSKPGTTTYRLLSLRPIVGIGTISYSAYLWHQPLLAFARTSSISPPPTTLMGFIVIITIGIAYLSWRFVEQPFRNRSLFSRSQIFALSGATSAALIATCLLIYKDSGLPQRVPGMGLGGGKYIAYNESAFRFKKDTFPEDGKPRLLVIGNSTGRDLVNMIVESRKFTAFSIVYRDDITPCHDTIAPNVRKTLFTQADAIILAGNWKYDGICSTLRKDTNLISSKPFVFVGPKHFGYNINIYIHTTPYDRKNKLAKLMHETIESNEKYKILYRGSNYVDIIKIMSKNYGGIPIFDESGRILSADRVHLTKPGAILFAQTIFNDAAWNPVFKLINKPHN